MQVFFTLVIRKLRLDVLISIFFLFFHILKKVSCTMSSQVSHLSIYLWAKTHIRREKLKKKSTKCYLVVFYSNSPKQTINGTYLLLLFLHFIYRNGGI